MFYLFIYLFIFIYFFLYTKKKTGFLKPWLIGNKNTYINLLLMFSTFYDSTNFPSCFLIHPISLAFPFLPVLTLSLSPGSPQHQVHKLQPLAPQEQLPVGGEHEASTEAVKQVLHHLLLLTGGRVVTFEHLVAEHRHMY